MGAVTTLLAEGWVADSERVNLKIELEAGAGGIRDTLDSDPFSYSHRLDQGTTSKQRAQKRP
jgi:hypothetical protein